MPFAAGPPCSETDPHVSSITWLSQWAGDHGSVVATRSTTELSILRCLKQTIGKLSTLRRRGFQTQYHLTILRLNVKSTKSEHQQRCSNRVPKKNCLLLRTFPPFKPIHVFGWFRPLPSLQASRKIFHVLRSFHARQPCVLTSHMDISVQSLRH